MTTLVLLAFIGLCVLLFLIIHFAGKTRKDLDTHNPNAEFEQEGGFYNATLDDSHRLNHILKLTWDYFDSHPIDGEFTELHYLSATQDFIDCQIIREEGADGKAVIKLLFNVDKLVDLPPCFAGQYENPLCVFFQDPSEREKAASIIKETLKAKDDTKIPYQLAGSNGPECFFHKEYLDNPNQGLIVSEDNDDHRLGHVFEKTWAFFRENPDSFEYTEVETDNFFIQISRDGTNEAPKYNLIIECKMGKKKPSGFKSGRDSNVYFEGADAAERAEVFVYKTLGLKPESPVRYQLAGSEGPDDFFQICNNRRA